MAEIVVDSKAKLCVELGVYGGRSLIALALGATLTDGRVDGIDPYDPIASVEGTHDAVNNAWWGTLDHEGVMRAALAGIEHNGLSSRTRIIRMKSVDAVGSYSDGSIDVLHQNSNHSEEVSTTEVARWAPKMRPGSVWIMDDTAWTRHGLNGEVIPTTLRAQQMLEERGFIPVEPHGNWCVFRRGTAKGAGSAGGTHLGGAILDNGGDANTWMPDIWERLIADYAVKSIVDVGCGAAYTTKWFKDRVGDVLGVEGDPVAWSQRKTDNVVLHDYTRAAFDPCRTFDLGWTAEFVEHVEERYMPNWMATLRRCRFVAMTFAVPGQGGHHHVNERPEAYWIDKFAEQGFENVPEETARMRATSKGEAWGRPTLTFFRNIRL